MQRTGLIAQSVPIPLSLHRITGFTPVRRPSINLQGDAIGVPQSRVSTTIGSVFHAIETRPKVLTPSTHPKLGVRSKHKGLHRYALRWIFRPILGRERLTRILRHTDKLPQLDENCKGFFVIFYAVHENLFIFLQKRHAICTVCVLYAAFHGCTHKRKGRTNGAPLPVLTAPASFFRKAPTVCSSLSLSGGKLLCKLCQKIRFRKNPHNFDGLVRQLTHHFFAGVHAKHLRQRGFSALLSEPMGFPKTVSSPSISKISSSIWKASPTRFA